MERYLNAKRQSSGELPPPPPARALPWTGPILLAVIVADASISNGKKLEQVHVQLSSTNMITGLSILLSYF